MSAHQVSDAVVEVLGANGGFAGVVDQDHGWTGSGSERFGEAEPVHAGEVVGGDDEVDGSIGEHVQRVLRGVRFEDSSAGGPQRDGEASARQLIRIDEEHGLGSIVAPPDRGCGGSHGLDRRSRSSPVEVRCVTGSSQQFRWIGRGVGGRGEGEGEAGSAFGSVRGGDVATLGAGVLSGDGEPES